jgi:hypothetical protein
MEGWQQTGENENKFLSRWGGRKHILIIRTGIYLSNELRITKWRGDAYIGKYTPPQRSTYVIGGKIGKVKEHKEEIWKQNQEREEKKGKWS